MNSYIFLIEPAALFSEQLHPACSLRVAGHHPSLPRTASTPLLLTIKPEGHHISEKAMAVLENGTFTGVASRLHLFESHRQSIVLRNEVFHRITES